MDFEIIKICFINDFMLKCFLHELNNGTYCVPNIIIIDNRFKCKNHKLVDKNHLSCASYKCILQLHPSKNNDNLIKCK